MNFEPKYTMFIKALVDTDAEYIYLCKQTDNKAVFLGEFDQTSVCSFCILIKIENQM